MKKVKNLLCVNTPRSKSGGIIFSLTIGKTYKAEYINDPEGWEVSDDNGKREVFFDTSRVFDN